MRNTVLVLAVACLAAGPLWAQEEANLEEVTAYTAFHAAQTAGDAAKATELARAYLEKFPKGQYAEALTKWLGGARWARFNEAIKKKDMAGMVTIGREALAQDPADVNYLYWMAVNLRTNELLGGGDAANAEAAAEFSRKAIERIEAGGVPVGVDAAKWNKDAVLAVLHQNLALVAAKQGKGDEALQHYQKSSALAPKDVALNARNTLGCGTLHKAKYDQAVAKYQALPEAGRTSDPPAAEATAAIDLANREADAAIECWARFLAVTAANPSETRNKVEQALGALYQYRHPDQPQGYQALVEKYKSGT
jgi:tetratricopeptide (TPR) repeat protein